MRSAYKILSYPKSNDGVNMRTNELNSIGKPYKIYAELLEDSALEQFIACIQQPSVIQGALMPDCHTGYVAPIGSVLKTEDTIFPSFVGYDIGCGMSECKLDILTEDITKDQLMSTRDEILKRIPIGFKRRSTAQPLQKSLLTMPMTDYAKQVLIAQGGTQIGTLGGGNHFLEIGTTNTGHLSIVVHSGSRGVGHKIATHHMKIAASVAVDQEQLATDFDIKNRAWYTSITEAVVNQSQNKPSIATYNLAKEKFISKRIQAYLKDIERAYPLGTQSLEGINYINDMNMALQFALDNREYMIEEVRRAITTVTGKAPDVLRFINRNHNHAERLVDNHWVHRKGATQANDGMLGVIPGNMVDGSFIVLGKGHPASMCSSSHGAGRVLSRKKAKEQLNVEDFNECTKHLVANHSENNLDESPKAYKSIFDVMEQQSDLVEVIDRVVPILNIKG